MACCIEIAELARVRTMCLTKRTLRMNMTKKRKKNYLTDYLKKKEPNSIKICVLLDKKSRRKIDVPVDYVGFEIEDKFVLGYGLDYEGGYRNIPYIGYVE